MTVSTVVDHNDYTGNGVTTSFPYTFRIFKKTDLTVSVVDLSENITELVLDTDYTVTNAGGYNGGNVVLTSPLAAGWQISIARELEPTQETDLRNQGKFFAEVHEDAFDKLTMLIQQAYSVFRLALRKPSSVANWYDALNNYIRNLRDPRDPQDAATKNYVDSLASTNLGRTLRVPEQIPQLPDAATRANKMPAFDSAGNPIVVLPPSGSASDVLIQLAAESGASLVGGAIQVFTNVAAMKAFAVKAGRVYYTKGYYTDNDGGGAYYIGTTSGSTPDGYGDHVASNGVFLLLISQPTDLRYGVKVVSTYDPATAWNNRNALQTMLRNQRFSYFVFGATGTYYVLGSIHPLRDYITIHHQAGCKIIGRYDDPSIPNSIVSQAGGMMGFAHFFDPDNGDFIPWRDGDTRINKPTIGVKYILDGDISTEYNAIHTNKYNNNCIGFLKGHDCEVTGSGGVSASDHRGVNFDGIKTNAPNGADNTGGSINCHIDISYCDNVVDNPVMIIGDYTTPSLCTINVGRVGKMITGGYNQPIVARVADGFDFRVTIGSFIGDNVIKPTFVGAYNCRSVDVEADYVNGASRLLYQYETLDSDVVVNEVYNTPVGITRAGTAANAMRSAKLHDIDATDSNFVIAYDAQVNTDAFTSLDITRNNFAYVGSTFRYYNNKQTAGLPVRLNIRDNIPPLGGMTVVELNYYPTGMTGNLVTVGATTGTVNFKSPDWNYTKMTVIAQASGVYGQCTIDLRTRALTAQAVAFSAGSITVNTTITGNNILNLSLSAGAAFQQVTLHN
ncbi:hypothetical protein [Enterobacter ludwigii]